MAENYVRSLKGPALKNFARSVGVVPGSKKVNNIRQAILNINRAQLNSTINTHKTSIAKAMFVDQGTAAEIKEDGEDIAEDLINSENDASTIMLQILPPQDKKRFIQNWKAFITQQVSNGSFLEFQGMRFMEPGTIVYDVERYNIEGGLPVFSHILQPPPPGKTKVYLKCKFKLGAVNEDNTPILPGQETWANLFKKKLAKGLVDCEPDVIVRTSDEIRIFEMKMGLGKKDTEAKASEANQLARCKHLFEIWLENSEIKFPSSNIKLFFVGWSAPSNGDVEFRAAPWSRGEYAVTAINGMGMKTYAPINSEIVTKIITMLNIIKLEQFYKAAGIFLKRWSTYYPRWKEFKRDQLGYIKTHSTKFGYAFNKPPNVAIPKPKTKAQETASRQTEERLRGGAQLVRQMAARQNISSSNSNNENAQVRRFNWIWRHTPQVTKNQRLIEQLTGNQLRALAARANALVASRTSPVNARILGLVSKNAANWDVTYAKFLNEHTNIPNASARINALLRNPPPNKVSNYTNKLQKKQYVNTKRSRPKPFQ